MARFKVAQFKLVEEAQKWFSSEWPMEPVSEALQGKQERRQVICFRADQRNYNRTTTEMAASGHSPQTLYRR